MLTAETQAAKALDYARNSERYMKVLDKQVRNKPQHTVGVGGACNVCGATDCWLHSVLLSVIRAVGILLR